jgi:putative pyruvate formate lyase activating enzyme
MSDYLPSYLSLFNSGALIERAKKLIARLASCDLCPRVCRINRLKEERGVCRSGALATVASSCAHFGEEPAISGSRGSGTIFFANCTMRCEFCQNHQISQGPERWYRHEISASSLADEMLKLQQRGCHNINLVSPTHFVPQIVQAVDIAAAQGLILPLVYNTGGYDNQTTIEALEGVVDIFMPDLKYSSDESARKYSHAFGYVGSARSAIKEMHRQVGYLELDDEGIAKRGLIVRHLILPGGTSETESSLSWLARDVSAETTVSLMSQYHPCNRAAKFPELNRTITEAEHLRALRALEKSGLSNGWVQDREASDYYLPDFGRNDNPFDS